MREIKFRAWDKKKNEMWNWCGGRLRFKDWGKHFHIIYENLDYELMQFTGLKDKNGKEVYEDDIIEFENQGKYVIIYREDSAMFYVRPTTNGEQIPIWLEYSKNNCPYGVIGNIYENPELLEGK